MARTQRSIEERISEKEIQYEQVMEKAKMTVQDRCIDLFGSHI